MSSKENAPMASASSEMLRQQLKEYIAAYDVKQSELSLAIGFSPTATSLWLNRKYPHDATAIEAALERWLSAIAPDFVSLTPRDKRRLGYILDLLHHADNKTALISAVVKTGNASPDDRQSTD